MKKDRESSYVVRGGGGVRMNEKGGEINDTDILSRRLGLHCWYVNRIGEEEMKDLIPSKTRTIKLQ